MSNQIRSALLRPLLFATALPLVMLAGGAAPALAGSVTVTGANGANGGPRQSGGAGGSATATTTTPSDPSNSATATGGNGGVGGAGGATYPSGAGGHGGAASSTATASNTSGSASATATSTGGNGGRGGLPNPCIHSCIPGAGGGGGAASAISSATGGGAGTVVTDATASGGAAAVGSNNPAAGTASAVASGASTGTGQVQADASALAGALRGSASASASASALNLNGSIVTTAAAPAAQPASALTNAEIGAGSSGSLVAIGQGQTVSNAILTPSGFASPGSPIGMGAMSAGYGESGSTVTYEATATFDFNISIASLDLHLLSDMFSDTSAGIAFDNMSLQIDVNGVPKVTKTFLSLTGSGGAQIYFSGQPLIGLGAIGPKTPIEIEYILGYNSGTSAAAGNGFGFTYALVDPLLNAAVPEPSTWVMLIIGFVGLGAAGCRTSRGRRRLSISQDEDLRCKEENS